MLLSFSPECPMKPWPPPVGDPRGQMPLQPRAAWVGGAARGPHRQSCPGRGDLGPFFLLCPSSAHWQGEARQLHLGAHGPSKAPPAMPGMQSHEGGPHEWGHIPLEEGSAICASLGLLPPPRKAQRAGQGLGACGRPVLGSGWARGLRGAMLLAGGPWDGQRCPLIPPSYPTLCPHVPLLGSSFSQPGCYMASSGRRGVFLLV